MYYKDIDIELTKAQDGDIVYDEDIDAVTNSIANIVKTMQGSRVMLPSFAFNGNELLFEPLSEDVAKELASIVWEAIEFWDSRVLIENIHVNVNHENSQYEMQITFSVQNITREPENITLILKR